MIKITIQKKALAALSSVVAISNIIAPSRALDSMPVDITNKGVNDKEPTKLIAIDSSEYQRKVKADNVGVPSITQMIGAILEDARGPCLGSMRCAIVLTNDQRIETEDRFKQLEIDKGKLGEYGISISGSDRKARIIAIMENTGSDHYYTHYILNRFISNKIIDMQDKGIESEVKIAENAIIKDIGRFTAIAMSPHAKDSMKIIEEGLQSLI